MYKTYCYGTQHSVAEQILDDGPRMRLSHQEGVVTLRLSQNMFEGSTGCHEWEAGFFLAEYVLNHPELVRGAPIFSPSGPEDLTEFLTLVPTLPTVIRFWQSTKLLHMLSRMMIN